MKRILLAILFSVLFTACGKSEDSSTASKSWPELAGTWVSDCTPTSSLTFKGIRTFNDASATLQVTFYQESSCLNVWAHISYEDSYSVGDAVANSTATKAIDYTARAASFTITDEAEIAGANEAKLYGYSDWKANEARDILGKKFNENSDPERGIGVVRYTIAKIDGNKLYSGDDATGDGTTPEKRPTAISNDHPLTKQ